MTSPKNEVTYEYRVDYSVSSLSGQCGAYYLSSISLLRRPNIPKARWEGAPSSNWKLDKSKILSSFKKSLARNLDSASKLIYSTNHNQIHVVELLKAAGFTPIGEEVINVNSLNKIQFWEINRHDLGMNYPDPDDGDDESGDWD